MTTYLVNQNVGDADVGSSYQRSMEGLNERIRTARHAAGLKQIEVAEHFGIKRPSVAQWEAGDSRPDQSKLAALADLFRVTVDWLLEAKGPGPVVGAKVQVPPAKRVSVEAFPPQIIAGHEMVLQRDLPVYAAAQGGSGHLIVTTEAIRFVRRPYFLDGVKHAYALLVVGESMSPTFRPNDMALVDPTQQAEPDTDVILYDHDPSTGEAEAIIKHLVSFTDKSWKLEQYRPAKVFSEHKVDWPICHRVVGKYDRRR